MITLILCSFAFVAGMLCEQYKSHLKEMGGIIRDGVLGAKPRAETNKLSVAKAAGNVASFFAMCLRNWKLIACIVLAVVILFFMRSCGDVFGWGKTRGEIRRDAERNQSTSEARGETQLAGAQEGERFRNDTRAIQDELQRGNEELESLPSETSALDFLTAWRDADSSLLNAGSPAG